MDLAPAAEAILVSENLAARPWSRDPVLESERLVELFTLSAPSPLPTELAAEAELLSTLTLDRFGHTSRVECLKVLEDIGGLSVIRALLTQDQRR